MPAAAPPASPAFRAGELWVAVEREEIPIVVQFSPSGGNGTVMGISELVDLDLLHGQSWRKPFWQLQLFVEQPAETEHAESGQ